MALVEVEWETTKENGIFDLDIVVVLVELPVGARFALEKKYIIRYVRNKWQRRE